MGKPRLQLQALLESLLGTRNVYFQPPENIQMTYPCIVYSREGVDTQYADNQPHRSDFRYTVTIIDRDPDSVTFHKIASLPLCSFERSFPADNLNHDVFTLYF